MKLPKLVRFIRSLALRNTLKTAKSHPRTCQSEKRTLRPNNVPGWNRTHQSCLKAVETISYIFKDTLQTIELPEGSTVWKRNSFMLGWPLEKCNCAWMTFGLICDPDETKRNKTKQNKQKWLINLDLGGICTVVCHGYFFIWNEYTWICFAYPKCLYYNTCKWQKWLA